MGRVPEGSGRGKRDEPGGLEPGWWGEIVHAIAVTYHWDEERILALPWGRVCEYLHRVAEYHGGHPVRELELLPETVELQRLMQRKLERMTRA